MCPSVSRREGRRVFGVDPGSFDRARLDYPERVYDILRTRCGLCPTISVFEVGAGTGIATRALLKRGVESVTAIEPDRRMARYLRGTLGSHRERVQVVTEPFERAPLPPGAFDLGVAATSFHWVAERSGLRKVARLLRPGGWWAEWGNRHGNPSRRSPFRDAIQPLYRTLARTGYRAFTFQPFKAERRKHLSVLHSLERFERISSELIRWSVRLSSAHVTTLWSTFSDVLSLPPKKRRWFLAEMRRTADEQFGGRVEIRMLTPIYTARRS
jgi:SAM-dependent methyltransferase